MKTFKYICTYKDKKWNASFEVIEESNKYSILQIQSKYKDLKVFLWHDNNNFWLTLPSEELTCSLSYPTDEFWNYESLYRHTEDEMVSKTVVTGISNYYKTKTI